MTYLMKLYCHNTQVIELDTRDGDMWEYLDDFKASLPDQLSTLIQHLPSTTPLEGSALVEYNRITEAFGLFR